MVVQAARKSAEERRDEILDAALAEFAERGLHGASTEAIAKRAGISQPYVFRLFGSKKQLFKAAVARCFRETLETFMRAAEGKRGEEALHAIGLAYGELLAGDRTRLLAQLQAYAACDDPEICAVVRDGYGDIFAYAERVSGLAAEEVTRFFAVGMLMNVLAAMNLYAEPEGWSQRLLAGCGKEI
jgi:AcrR family transcriptional regulator